jgi:PGM1 C-terminal domain/ATP-grasp domain
MAEPENDRFELLQARLGALGPRALSDLDEGCIVVLPSITFPVEELRKIIGIGRYEERLLCMLLLLRAPKLEMVFISSLTVDPVVIDYYLSFLDDPEGARQRVRLVALDDADPLPLSEKLLARQGVLEDLSTFVEGKDAYLLPFNVTAAERAVATSIQVPIYGPRPGLAYAGSKSGSRHVAVEAGVEVLPGSEDLHSLDAVDAALETLGREHPEAVAAVIKLNYGFSGQGNAVVTLGEWNGSVVTTPTVFCADEESWESFGPKIERDGAIVEEMILDPGIVSPSVQLRIAADGSFEVVSTHDQILGGPGDQVYLGCRFPAHREYRGEIQEAGLRVAKTLAAKGVVGSFGIDFVIVPSDGQPAIYLSEINLRLGGTSHPFYTARFATGGSYDPVGGTLVVEGAERCYIATDNLKSERYKALKPSDLLAHIEAEGLAYRRDSGTGVILHMLGAVAEHGKLGVTCIAATIDEANDLYAAFVACLERYAGPG